MREKSTEQLRAPARPVSLDPRHKTPIIVVEHRQRHRAEERERVHMPVDPCLGRRRRVRPNVRRVALRQVEGEEMDLALDPADERPRFTEISLPMPRRMNQRHVHLPAPAMMLAHVVLHDRVPAGEAVLVAKTLENALRRVLLLAMVVVAIPALADTLRPALAKYLEPTTDRVGNGLFLLFGGPGRLETPTVSEFSEVLVNGTARLGATRVVDLLLGWIDGEPFHIRQCAILEGVNIEKPLRLDEGVLIAKLPSSGADLPASLTQIEVVATEFLGRVVLSIDCELAPSLYAPEYGDDGRPLGQNGTMTAAANKIPKLSLRSFCESMSLACGEYVDWRLRWTDYGDVEAFSFAHFGAGSKPRWGGRRTAFAQKDLERAREIHLVRYGAGSGDKRRDLDQAISRWMKSKRSYSDADRLIELRIALEALYGKGAMNEKAFRVSAYGAWHLGGTVDRRRKVRDALKKAYDDASLAIHAGDLKHTKRDKQLLPTAQAYCLEGILKRLEESDAPNWDEVILGAHPGS